MRSAPVLRMCAVLVLLLFPTGWLLAQGSAVQLQLPAEAAFDAQGDLFVADSAGHVIFEYPVAGGLRVVAGSGVEGFAGDGGPATSAELDSPQGVAVDQDGNLLIADTHNNRVRRVSAATGVVTSIAGTGVAGFFGDGGPASLARLSGPASLAVGPGGDIYVADTNNQRIRRITAGSGVIATVAGSGVEGFSGDGAAATSAAMDSPRGLALDGAGNLLFADTGNSRIRRVDGTSGKISTVAGAGTRGFGGDGGLATAAKLASPRGVAVDGAGKIYISDSGNQRLRVISAAGILSTLAGDGTEGFAGDGGVATNAHLDGPAGVTLSPAGLVTFSDTGNGRVRQLSSAAQIHTLIGTTAGGTTEMLMVTGPSTSVYGSGSVTATLSPAVSGTVSFAESTPSGAMVLGSAQTDGDGTASLTCAGLPAGMHSLFATYAGDATHSAAQSSTVAMTVTPAPLVAVADAISVPYGTVVPILTGRVSGVLAQDAGKVEALFVSSANILSPVGSYPISATLSGAAAGNYSVSLEPTAVMVVQAASQTSLVVSNGSITAGLPVSLSVRTASTTSGSPTGTVMVLDGGTLLASLSLSTSGTAAMTAASLAQGSHSITARYAGDANFLPSSSAASVVTVGAPADFAIASSGASTVSAPAGTAAVFNFAVATQGGLSSPIVLAVQGLPGGATASLNPSSLVPGGATAFQLTIQTPMALIDTPKLPGSRRYPGWPLSCSGMIFIPLGLWGKFNRERRRGRNFHTLAHLAAAGATCIITASLAAGCGDRVNTSLEQRHPTSYTITVIGTATGPAGNAIQHSANVTLEVL